MANGHDSCNKLVLIRLEEIKLVEIHVTKLVLIRAKLGVITVNNLGISSVNVHLLWLLLKDKYLLQIRKVLHSPQQALLLWFLSIT